jgi:hypothetical protein
MLVPSGRQKNLSVGHGQVSADQSAEEPRERICGQISSRHSRTLIDQVEVDPAGDGANVVEERLTRRVSLTRQLFDVGQRVAAHTDLPRTQFGDHGFRERVPDLLTACDSGLEAFARTRSHARSVCLPPKHWFATSQVSARRDW